SMSPCTEGTLKKLSRGIEATSANMGGTNMEEALSSTFALPLPKNREVMPAVLLVTDGDVWAVDSIIKTAKASGHRIFAIGVGDSPAESLLREMAEQTGGACEFVTSSENMAEAIIRMFRRMRGSIAHDIRIDWHGETLWQSALPKFIYDGETVHCFAAMRAVPDCLPHLCWTADGREYSASVERLESASSDDLFRLGKARQMEETEDEGERKAIALEYQLVSDATSLILTYERAAEDKADGMPQIEHIRQMPAHRELDAVCCDCGPLYQGAPAAGRAMASIAPSSPRASRMSRSMKSAARRPASDIMMSCELDMSFMMADMDMELPACFRIPALLEELADQFNANSLLFSTVTECLDEILQDSDFAPVKEFLEKLKEKAGEAEGNIPDDETLFAAFMLWVFRSVGIRIDRHAFRLLRNATAKDKDMMKEATRVTNDLCEKWLHGDLE
ncbi:MAG: VWA domain-containing protein, partial [Desulfovibrionaceae bacterium]|nr:VWA domain-containing protein [Desulfovibrionaceae bacterium]